MVLENNINKEIFNNIDNSTLMGKTHTQIH